MGDPQGANSSGWTIRDALWWLMALAAILFLIQKVTAQRLSVGDIEEWLDRFELAEILSRNTDRETFKQRAETKVNDLVTAKPKPIPSRWKGDVTITKIAARFVTSIASKRHPKKRGDEHKYREGGVVYL